MDYADNEIIAQIRENLEEDLAGWSTEVDFEKIADGYLYFIGYRNLLNDRILIRIPNKPFKTITEMYKESSYKPFGLQDWYSLY